MLAYWTRQYLLVLLGSLLLLALIAGFWVRLNAYEQLYNLMELRADQMAELSARTSRDGFFFEGPRSLDANRPRFPGPLEVIYIASASGNIQVIKRDKSIDITAVAQVTPFHHKVLGGEKVREKFKVDGQTWLRVGVPVQDGTISKALYLATPARGILAQLRRLYGLLALLTITISLTGWLLLCFLSRRLTSPLMEISSAARLISEGKYDPPLPHHVKEKELRQLVVSFQDMASRLKQMEQLRTDLLAGVSHELRTPLTSIRGMIQAVQDKVVTGQEAEEFMRISLKEAKRLQQMVEELLDLASFEAGAEPIQREMIESSHLVGEAVRQVKYLPEFSGIRFELDLPQGPLWIKADGGRLRQILLNLLNNSQRASAGLIKIALRTEEKRLVLEIWDNGKGIAPKDQPYIFERFYRGAPGQSGKRGLGLGLTLSRLLARAHGGDLELRETSAEGTVFQLSLPLLQE